MIGQTVVFEFIETTSQAEELAAVLERLKNQAGGQMPALQEAQRIYGYLPIEVLQRIANILFPVHLCAKRGVHH